MLDVDFAQLLRAYAEYLKIDSTPGCVNRFDDFVEGHLTRAGPISEEVKEKIRWLSGPHGAALYKAWRIRNGQTDTD